MQQSKKKKQPQLSQSMKQLLNDPNNIFNIQNPQILPPLTKSSQNILRDLLKSSNIVIFKLNSQNWINHFNIDRRIRQMLFKIKQIKTGDELNPKYSVQLFPIYEKVSINHAISNSTFLISGSIFNLSKDSFKDYLTYFKWNYRQNYLSVLGQITFSSPWALSLKRTWGKPLDNTWVADSRKFNLFYLLPSDSRRVGRTNFRQGLQSALYWEMKGYDTRLGRLVQENAGVYSNTSSLKKIDVIEAGYVRNALTNNGDTSINYKIGLGTDYYHMWYCKAMGRVSQYYRINSKINLMAYGEAGLIEGKNIIAHQCFSRNENKWMGERSLVYGHCRFDLFGRGFPLLEALRLVPSNYLSLWLSKSFEKKIKLEAELGISFSVPQSPFKFDISLLRLSGVKGQPRFGLKYEF